MSEETWALLTSRETVLALALLAIYVGGVVGLSRTLPGLLMRDAGWRADTARHPVSSALLLTALVCVWPVSGCYLVWRVMRRRRGA